MYFNVFPSCKQRLNGVSHAAGMLDGIATDSKEMRGLPYRRGKEVRDELSNFGLTTKQRMKVALASLRSRDNRTTLGTLESHQ